MKVAIRIGTAGRGQLPNYARKELGIGVGDTIVVEIKEVLKKENLSGTLIENKELTGTKVM